MDYMIRATAAEGQIRAFAATTKELVEVARAAHNTSPVATAALGRTLTGTAMLGIMMKGDRDVLTVQIKGDGPIMGITATADAKGHVKGFVGQPEVLLHANAKGKLDVGGAVGRGYMRVIKDLGLKEPYTGEVELQTGEIAEDFTYYLTLSEQVPSAVGLGVLMNKENTVRRAGGFILQLMPGVKEEVVDALEQKLAGVNSVTSMLDAGDTPEMILERLLGDFGLEILDTIPVSFVCNCSKDRMAKALMAIGRKELESIVADGHSEELRCHFCNSSYIFEAEELAELLRIVSA